MHYYPLHSSTLRSCLSNGSLPLLPFRRMARDEESECPVITRVPILLCVLLSVGSKRGRGSRNQQADLFPPLSRSLSLSASFYEPGKRVFFGTQIVYTGRETTLHTVREHSPIFRQLLSTTKKLPEFYGFSGSRRRGTSNYRRSSSTNGTAVLYY